MRENNRKYGVWGNIGSYKEEYIEYKADILGILISSKEWISVIYILEL